MEEGTTPVPIVFDSLECLIQYLAQKGFFFAVDAASPIIIRRTDCLSPLDDLEGLYGLAHVAGWEPYDLHYVAHAKGVGSVLHMYSICTPYAYLMTAAIGCTVDDLHDIYFLYCLYYSVWSTFYIIYIIYNIYMIHVI